MTHFFEKDMEKIFNELTRPFFNGFGDLKDCAVLQGNPNGTKSYSFGYAMTVGPNGQVTVKKLGDSNPVDGCATHNPDTGVREPIVDTIVDEKETELKLIVELPGVEKQDVKVAVEENKTVDISTEHDVKKYHVRVPLKHEIVENSAKATYNNGILQLVFKLVDKTPSSTQIEIE